MSNLSSHFIGEITEQQVALEFLKLGYLVSKPLVQSSRYDFIVDINHNLYRIQVKTSSLSADEDYIEFRTQSSHTNTQKTVYHSYSAEDIDYFATVYNHQCYLVPVDKTGSRSFRLRLKPTKNGQTKNINFAKDFKLEDTFIK